MAAILPSPWLHLRSRKTRRPVKAAVKEVARVAANRVAMAAVVVAEANAAKVRPAKFAPPAKLDAEVKAALKVVKAMAVRHAVIVQSVVSVASAKSVQHARAAGMVAPNVQTANLKAAPMSSQS